MHQATSLIRCISGQVKQTEYGRRVSYIDQLIRENFTFNNMKMVRIRTLIDGMVIPHKDFVEMEERSRCLRVFIPLEDNALSFQSDEENVFQMRKGEAWFLDAAIVHAAVNFSNKSRIALCLDYVCPEKIHHYEEIFSTLKSRSLPPRPTYVSRPNLKAGFEEGLITQLSQIITRYNFKDLVFLLTKIHFYKNVSITVCYDWLLDITKRQNDVDLVNKAESLREYLIKQRGFGERFAFNDWDN